jgi:hypothetical protein
LRAGVGTSEIFFESDLERIGRLDMDRIGRLKIFMDRIGRLRRNLDRIWIGSIGSKNFGSDRSAQKKFGSDLDRIGQLKKSLDQTWIGSESDRSAQKRFGSDRSAQNFFGLDKSAQNNFGSNRLAGLRIRFSCADPCFRENTGNNSYIVQRYLINTLLQHI